MNAEEIMNTSDGLGGESKGLADLLETYKNGRRVRKRRHSWESPAAARIGTIEGTSLGGATKRGGNRPMLNVHVNWDDGTESDTTHWAIEPLTT